MWWRNKCFALICISLYEYSSQDMWSISKISVYSFMFTLVQLPWHPTHSFPCAFTRTHTHKHTLSLSHAHTHACHCTIIIYNISSKHTPSQWQCLTDYFPTTSDSFIMTFIQCAGAACFSQAALEQRWEGREKRQRKREEGQPKNHPSPSL